MVSEKKILTVIVIVDVVMKTHILPSLHFCYVFIFLLSRSIIVMVPFVCESVSAGLHNEFTPSLLLV